MKQHTTYKILLFLVIIAGTWSCERDDICAETTATTPHLIIRFYDINDPEEIKAVRELKVRGLDADGNELGDITVDSPYDSIVLPLKFQGEGITTTSKFILEKDSDFFDNGDPDTDSNIDIITINYIPKFEYVSRACGYKSIFDNLSISIEQDGNNWVLTSEILTTTINNEDQAHIILRH